MHAPRKHVYVTPCRAVHFKFKLKSQTLYTTISLILRYLSKVTSPLASPYDHRSVVVQPVVTCDMLQVNTPRKNLQTLGVAALYVSAKFEERFPPHLRDLEYITGYRCVQNMCLNCCCRTRCYNRVN